MVCLLPTAHHPECGASLPVFAVCIEQAFELCAPYLIAAGERLAAAHPSGVLTVAQLITCVSRQGTVGAVLGRLMDQDSDSLISQAEFTTGFPSAIVQAVCRSRDAAFPALAAGSPWYAHVHPSGHKAQCA